MKYLKYLVLAAAGLAAGVVAYETKQGKQLVEKVKNFVVDAFSSAPEEK